MILLQRTLDNEGGFGRSLPSYPFFLSSVGALVSVHLCLYPPRFHPPPPPSTPPLVSAAVVYTMATLSCPSHSLLQNPPLSIYEREREGRGGSWYRLQRTGWWVVERREKRGTVKERRTSNLSRASLRVPNEEGYKRWTRGWGTCLTKGRTRWGRVHDRREGFKGRSRGRVRWRAGRCWRSLTRKLGTDSSKERESQSSQFAKGRRDEKVDAPELACAPV